MKFKNDFPKGTKEVIGITGMSLGLGMIGDAVGGDIGNELSSAGVTSAKFISPAVNISMGGNLINMIKKIGKEK